MSKRALISVSDKTGVVEFARGLVAAGYEIVSTGGTFKLLKDAGLPVLMVSDITGFPEILDGRVKTLHPKIHGGILARRELAEHREELARHEITPIDVVAVNLYPFRETVMKARVSREEAIENIDIGGPSMIRSAAKNYRDVVVIVDPSDYGPVLDEIKASGAVSPDTRFKLALKAFSHTAAYDAMIASYFAEESGVMFPDSFSLAGTKLYDLRYGENPHQQAAFYRGTLAVGGIASARQLHGKELSYNNIIDCDAAWSLVQEFAEPASVIIKHTNPCGVALGKDVSEAWERAFAADPVSAFGGIVAFNREIDAKAAQLIAEPFLEVVLAPSFTDEALKVLGQKKNVRLLEVALGVRERYQVRTVQGGFVVQTLDLEMANISDLKTVTQNPVPDELWPDLLFALKVVKHVKSNAIVVARDGATLGIGAGQMNRVGAAKIALEQAGEKANGAVMASDAFFPFPDTVELAAAYGIRAIIQPGGSVRDQESIAACDRLGLAMLFTGIRHFKH